MATQIVLRVDTAANWADANPILGVGEPGYDETNNIFKIGNGILAWADLPGIQDGGAGGSGGGGGGGGTIVYPVTSVAGRMGDIVLSSTDLTDGTPLGRSIFTAEDGATVRTAIGASSLTGNAVVISGADTARNDPISGVVLPTPPTCIVLWVSATLPTNLLTGDIWLNDPSI